MPAVLPFEIIALIIDIVGENKDTNLLRELALVSHSFLQICYKHLYATVELHDAVPRRQVASSVKVFVKLLKSRPDVVKYIRKLSYKFDNCFQSPPFSPTNSSLVNDDHAFSFILPNLLQTIPSLNCLAITASKLDWNTLDSSLTSAFLHLMHLPTINHIELSFIRNFPLSSLTPAINLLRLGIFHLNCTSDDTLEEDGSPEFVVQSEIMPKIREFHTSKSDLLTTKLLHAKRQDGQPAFNFMSLRRLSISTTCSENEGIIRYLLQNAKLLEKLHFSYHGPLSLLRYNLLPSARTLKVLDLTVPLRYGSVALALAVLCEELEAMAGHNRLESLSFEVPVYSGGRDADDYKGPITQEVQKVLDLLVKPGWSALRQISFIFSFTRFGGSRNNTTELSEALQSLPDKYLNVSKLVFVDINLHCLVAAYVVKCKFEFH